MARQDRGWRERADQIASLLSDEASRLAPIGGRFVCGDDDEFYVMYDFFTAHGFSIRDTGQCEVVATKCIAVSDAAVREAISGLQRLASIGGYRLQSVEAGDFDAGKARVLASEEGYVPWWDCDVED